MGEPRWITEKELAEMYGVAVQTVRNWRFRRQGPPYTKANRMVRYNFEAAIDYMNRRTITPEK